MGRKLIAFGWYGGKYSHLDWLLPLLPEAKCQAIPCYNTCKVFMRIAICQLILF